jgi:hypothetical protein
MTKANLKRVEHAIVTLDILKTYPGQASDKALTLLEIIDSLTKVIYDLTSRPEVNNG